MLLPLTPTGTIIVIIEIIISLLLTSTLIIVISNFRMHRQTKKVIKELKKEASKLENINELDEYQKKIKDFFESTDI